MRITTLLTASLVALIFTHTVYAQVSSDSLRAVGRYHLTDSGYTTDWPGVYFEAAFRGTLIGVQFEEGLNYYNVEIDGELVQTVSDKSNKIEWFPVSKGNHLIRVSKRTESHFESALFKGFVAGKNTTIISSPKPKKRQMEIIGDSNFAGLGLESPSRECSEAEIRQYSNADKTFSVLTARAFDADYHLNAYSGQGMVRNWGGSSPGVNYREFYKRTLTTNVESTWKKPDHWNPEIVLIGLGTNDFSTPVKEGEHWTNPTLHAAYKSAYIAFLKKLRSQYGNDSLFILASQSLANKDYFNNMIDQIVLGQKKEGDRNIIHWKITGMEYTSCLWHYSEKDHRTAANQLIEIINARWAM